MNAILADLVQAGLWVVVLAGGLTVAMGLRRLGVATTYVRDLLHIGAGVWVLGWPAWREPLVPIALCALVTMGMFLVPCLAGRVRLVARLAHAVSDDDERWAGLERYTLAFLLMTAAGFLDRGAPAAAGLLALSLGDGIGGAVGRRFGRVHYTAPGGKRKSLEGSAFVALAAAGGVALAGWWFATPLPAALVLAGALTAAVAEGLAPRGTDNVVVPVAVWAVLRTLA